MEHIDKSTLLLLTYDELPQSEKKKVEQHLLSCEQCNAEYEELLKLPQMVKSGLTVDVDEDTLFEARQELLAEIRNMKRKKFSLQKIMDSFSLSPKWHVAFAYSVAAVALIVTVTHFSFLKNVSNGPGSEVQENSGEVQLSNLRFINSNFENGEVELAFDRITPVSLKGKVDDSQIQKILAKSLLDNENPGIRLKTVSAIAAEKNDKSSGVFKGALINAVKYDNNPGVRKEAMTALCRLPFDDQVNAAVVYVLQNDKNSGLRIMAINCLSDKNEQNQSANPELINVLKKKMQDDSNSYIKLRAKSLLTKLES